MPLGPDELTSAVEYLRTVLTQKKESFRRELDYTEQRDAVLSVKNRFPDISDDQIHEVMRRVEE